MTIRKERHYDSDLLGTTLFNLRNTVVPVNVQNINVGNGADATEDVLATFSLPANTLSASANGGAQGVLIEAWGTTGANGNNKTIKLYFGSVAFTHVSAGALNNVTWWAEIWAMRTALNTYSVLGSGQYGTTLSTLAGTISNSVTETAAIVIKATGQSGSSAANDVVCNNLTVWTIEQ